MALDGAAMMGLGLFRQGEEIAAIMEASRDDGTPLYRTVVVRVPRRGTKTTAIWATILGRCKHIPGYKVVTTAQDGIRARNRFREVQRALQLADFEGDRSISKRLGKLRWANGDEAIEFDNGSRVWVVPPESSAFRGEAADLILFDEAGELSLTRSEDLVAGALPLMDTRPRGQVVIAGTPGKTRSGMLWTFLDRAQAKDRGLGLVDYSIRDEESSTIIDENGDHQLNRKVVRRVHPGIGTLTTMSVIEERFSAMPLEQFEREYLCRFPFDLSVSAIPAALWENARADVALPPRPGRVGLAFDCAPDGSTAALVAAWRDDTGRAHVELLGYRPGTGWLVPLGRDAARKHRVPVSYDSIGGNTDPADMMHRARVTLAPKQLKHVQGAAARLLQELESGNFTHYSQPDLDAAVAGAAWRSVGDSGRLFARKASNSDVCPIVAASLALWQYDEIGERRPQKIITAGGTR